MDRNKDEFRHGRSPAEHRLGTGLAGGEGSLASTVPTEEEIAAVEHERDKKQRYDALKGGAAIE